MRRLGFSPVRLGLVLAMGVVLAVAVGASVAILSGGEDTQAAPSATPGKPVKIVIAGTNDALEPQTDGGIVGEGTFRASGAITDKGTVTAYRGVNGGLILLRFVTKGEKGAISYLVNIDTTRRPVVSRWRIESATRAYKGLHGKGTETENATYTVSTLRGKVWR
jgi:poly(3-hydroxybutyrate) depolymerase